jgi:hypothetical protein
MITLPSTMKTFSQVYYRITNELKKRRPGFDILTCLLFIVIYLRNKGYESNFHSYSQDVIQHLGAPYDYGKKT